MSPQRTLRPQVWAHRGASHEAPENTLAAFERAIRCGADGVELDVQRSSDGILVVTHDETCERLTGQPGQVSKLTLAQLLARNYAFARPEWPNTLIPTLAEVLDLFRTTSMQINVELKNSDVRYPGLEREVIDLVKQFNMQEQVIYSSFNFVSVTRVHVLAPQARTGLLYSEQRQHPFWIARMTGATALHPSKANLTIPGLVKRAHAHDLAVHVWTVDTPELWQRCADLGVDALITNEPRKAVEFFSAAGSGELGG